jgi:predicted amidohydrolase
MAEERRSERSLRVAALPLDTRRDAPHRVLAQVLRGLEEAAEQRVRLVLLPEMWPTSFPDPGATALDIARRIEDDAAAWLVVEERATALDLWVGGSAFASNGTQKPFNRFRLVGPGGELMHYDKAHLFTPNAEPLSFTAGDLRPNVAIGPLASDGNPVRIAAAICYDLRFGYHFQHLGAQGVELLMVPAQWAAVRASQWRALVIGRAVELQCFVVACNRTGSETIGRRELVLDYPGNALVVAPSGEVLAEGDGSGRLLVAELDLEQVDEARRLVPVVRDARRAAGEAS